MSDPWFKFYPSDWLGGTRALSAAESGVYITLICMMHEAEGPVMTPHDRLARLMHMPTRNFRRALDALMDLGKIVEKDGGLWNERVGETLDERCHNAKMNSQAAKSRWKKNKQKQSNDDAGALRTQCHTRSQMSDREDTSVSSTRKRKSRMREDAVISDAMRRAAEKRGHSQHEAEAQFSKFQNDAIAKGKTFVDWDRAFVTWLDSPYFRPITTGGQDGRRNADGSAAAMAQRIAERRAARRMDSGESDNAAIPLFSAGRASGGSGGGY